MNDHNLDDLIIDNIEPNKTKKSNSLLTIAALSIIVLVIAIILTKVILKDPEVEQINVEQNETEFVSPDLTLQPADEEKNEIEVPIPEPSQEEKVVEQEPALEPAPVPEIKEEPTTPPIVTSKPKPQPAKEVVPKIETPKGKKPKSVKVPVVPVEKAAQKPTARPVNVITRPGSAHTATTSAIYYIQVGAFKTSPSKQFIRRITKNGFRYKVITSQNGSKKVLVGPYSSRQSVDKALIQVRNRITKDAFVYTK